MSQEANQEEKHSACTCFWERGVVRYDTATGSRASVWRPQHRNRAEEGDKDKRQQNVMEIPACFAP